VKAEIIAIGTEILLGEIVDTNSAHIAQSLPELGIDLYYKSVVGDNMGRIVETLQRAWDRSDLIVITGGLGPTEDDMTREGISRLLDETPFVVPELEDRLHAFFTRRGYPMPPSNIKQAWLIPSARAIDNPRGTAPGWWVERDGRVIVCMPGVPGEMERMWANEVKPELEKRSDGQVLVTRTIKTLGIGEGSVDEMARHLYQTPGVGIGTYARADGVILPVEEEMDRVFGAAIWGKDEETLEGHIRDLLAQRNATLASMESCTGGLFASTLTDVAGSMQVYPGGIVTYTTEMKILNGVPADVIAEYGVISLETASAMAAAARERLDADYGLGITGVAGPDPQDGVEPGTVHIAVADPTGGTHHMSMSMNQGRQAVKRRAVTTAMLLLRRVLTAEP
jgi:nicotinamide-nucleotide amidase